MANELYKVVAERGEVQAFQMTTDLELHVYQRALVSDWP
jgi:hypothetical protein